MSKGDDGKEMRWAAGTGRMAKWLDWTEIFGWIVV